MDLAFLTKAPEAPESASSARQPDLSERTARAAPRSERASGEALGPSPASRCRPNRAETRASPGSGAETLAHTQWFLLNGPGGAGYF